MEKLIERTDSLRIYSHSFTDFIHTQADTVLSVCRQGILVKFPQLYLKISNSFSLRYSFDFHISVCWFLCWQWFMLQVVLVEWFRIRWISAFFITILTVYLCDICIHISEYFFWILRKYTRVLSEYAISEYFYIYRRFVSCLAYACWWFLLCNILLLVLFVYLSHSISSCNAVNYSSWIFLSD